MARFWKMLIAMEVPASELWRNVLGLIEYPCCEVVDDVGYR